MMRTSRISHIEFRTVDPAAALSVARQKLVVGWIPTPLHEPKAAVLDARGLPALVYSPEAVYFAVYPAIWRGFWSQTSNYAAAEYATTELLNANTNPRATRFAVHPALLHRAMPARSLFNFGLTATKLQCIDLVDHLLREIRG